MASFWADFMWSWSITVFLFTLLTTFLASLWWYCVKNDTTTSKEEAEDESTLVKEKLRDDSSPCKVLEVDILEDIREVLLNEDGNSKPAALHGKALLKVKHKKWQEEDSNVLKDFLRHMAFDEKVLESLLVEATNPLVKHLKAKDGKSTDSSEVMSFHALNILYSFAFGICFDIEDERLVGIKNELEAILKLWPNFSIKCQQSPESEPLSLQNAKGEFLTRMRQIMMRHAEVNELKQQTLIAHLLDRESLESTEDDVAEYLLMVFLCGYPSLAKFFSSTAVLLAENSEVQEKVFKCLHDDVSSVPESVNEPYIEATLQEILRCVKPVPFAVRLSHSERSGGDNELKTCDTVTRMHLDAILDGGKYWECPEMFNPSRFLDDKGAIMQKDAYLPYSIGSRSCPGMVLAELAGYVFLVTVLKDFFFSMPKQPEDADDEKLKGQSPMLVCISSRKQHSVQEK